MKTNNLKSIVFIAIIVLTINYSKSYAQSTSAGVGIGNVWTPFKFLGWGNTSGDLFFRTNNINRMVLQNNTGFVGVNTTAPDAQLHIVSTQGNSNGSNTCQWLSTTQSGGFFNLGSYIEARNADQNMGTYTEAKDGSFSNIGHYTEVFAPMGAFSGIGIYCDVAGTGNQKFGGYFETRQGQPDFEGSVNTAVYGEASGAFTNYAIYGQVSGSAPNHYAGYFVGDVVRTGTDNFTSDAMFKDNINNLNNSLSLINQLEPKTFNFKTADYPYMTFPSGIRYGLIAQDVESILPELVNNTVHPGEYDKEGNELRPSLSYKTLNYEAFIPILIGAVQEQQAIIEGLNARIEQLESETGGITPQGGNDVNSALVNAAILYQNTPNPFTNETTISYYVPENAQNAQIVLYDNYGKALKTINIAAKGNGNTTINLAELSNGIYSYSLVIDGKVSDAKKMMKQ
ncbi:MAG: tail fiber domain-containing protein [Bacteroidia bacterium]